jgi:hypothetical protein
MQKRSLLLKVRPTKTKDSGKVRLGGAAPALPLIRSTPTKIADSGKVRLGGAAPSFGPTRAGVR